MIRYYDIMSIQPLVVTHKAIHGGGTCPACAHVPNAYICPFLRVLRYVLNMLGMSPLRANPS